ncbi:LytR C-terminal domain-containing protein [Patescibacteria group bacterium]|nr:LytR C-terminal domain-containing protein [Patescibacteria group bacterium]
MQDIIVSINKNILRVSTVDKEASLKTALVDVPKDIVDDTRIIDPNGLSTILDNLVSQVSSLGKSKLSLNFLIEPQDVFLRYVTVSKNGANIDEQVVLEIKEKDPDVDLNNLYFSYKKMAPFIYQFIGVRKDVMEKYMDLSNTIGIGLKSVIPWVLGLPKYEKVNDPAIFVSKIDGEQVIALSELNGVFFAGTYKKEKSPAELKDLIKDLSFYKRSSPIKCIFTLNCDSFSLPDYEVTKVSPPDFKSSQTVPEGFELNAIVNFLLDSEDEILEGGLNMLNLLPLPVVESKSSVLIVAGSVAGALILLIGGYFGIRAVGNRDVSLDTQIAQETNQQNLQDTQVLSESVEQTQGEDSENTQSNDSDPNLEVKKGNLKIRVENGAGVSGLAKRTKEFLEGFGYAVLTIATADAKTDPTILNFKKDMISDYESLVTEDMKSNFPEIEIKQDLPDDSDYDLLIIVGTSSEL